ENDEGVVAEAEKALKDLKKEVAGRELEALLSGEADRFDSYLEVHAGAGGTESQDWAEMLLRMYTRWAEKHGFKIEYLEETQGEEAGIKSATIQISGHNAYGWLKTDAGVQTSDSSGVLDGDLDEFMAATLAQRAFGTTPGAVEDVD